MKYLIIISLFLVSCQQSIRVENDIIDELQILINLETEPLQIQNVGTSTGDIYDDNILMALQSSTITVNGSISDIKSQDEELFLIDTINNRFISIDEQNYDLVHEYDLSGLGKPIDLIFPNASNGYFTIQGKDSLFIVDIKFRKLVRSLSIPTGSKPTSLEVDGNQVFVTNENDNSISIIQTNSKQEIDKIILPSSPRFLKRFSNENSKLLVVCENAENGSSVVFVDIASRSASQAYTLRADGDYGKNFPNTLEVTNEETDYAYIGTDKGVYRADLRNEGLFRFVSFREEIALDLKFNESEDEMILLSEIVGQKYVRTATALSFSTKTNILVSPNSSFIFPLFQ